MADEKKKFTEVKIMRATDGGYIVLENYGPHGMPSLPSYATRDLNDVFRYLRENMR